MQFYYNYYYSDCFLSDVVLSLLQSTFPTKLASGQIPPETHAEDEETAEKERVT